MASFKKRLGDQRDRRAGARKELKVLSNLNPPKEARGPFKRLRKQYRRFIDKVDGRIATLRDKKRQARGGQQQVALRWALAQVGKTEQPPGSNDGEFVRSLWTYLGYRSPVPWCGCFIGFAAGKVAGFKFPNLIRLGYCPSITADARAHANGLRAVSAADARPGDFVVLFNSGHVGMLRKPVEGSKVPTVEGNTSFGDTGSQSNGGCVAERVRSLSDVTVFARWGS